MQPCVWIVFARLGIYPALGKMLGDSFAALGWEVVIADRPLAVLPDCGLLLLLGSGGLRPALVERLGECSRQRPVTVLWQLEPLPPVTLSPWRERVGLQVAAWDWDRLSPRARRLLAWAVPFQHALLRWVRRRVARPYARQVQPESGLRIPPSAACRRIAPRPRPRETRSGLAAKPSPGVLRQEIMWQRRAKKFLIHSGGFSSKHSPCVRF